MRSETSYFNKTVFWHDLKRFWPLTAGYALIWLLLLPLSRLTELNHAYLSAWNAQYETLDIAAVGGYWSAFLTGVLFAMAAFSYLTNPRATSGLHALPARRETLYVTHYLAGLCSQLAPQVLTVALTAAVMASHAAADARLTGLMLLALVLPTLFFYSFGVFCMMFTGQILAAPVFYGILNVLVVGVESLIRILAGNFLYGWADSGSLLFTPLSPIVYLAMNGVRATTAVYTRTADGSVRLLGLGWLALYAAAGLVFAALGLLVYRKRHSEATGATVAVYWARPVFKYGVAFCTALALGQLLYYLFFGQYRANGVHSLPGTLACMAAAGLIGYFLAEMLLKKSFHVFRTGWKGAAAVTAVLLALGCVLSLDLSGYERWAPDASAVVNARVDFNIYGGDSHIYAKVTDRQAVERVIAAHRALAGDKARQQNAGVDPWRPYESGSGAGTVSGQFAVTYTLADGRTVRRRYAPILLRKSALSDPSSPESALTALYNDPNVILMRALGKYGYDVDADPRELPDLRFTGGYVSVPGWANETYLGEQERDLTPDEAQTIYDAILRDVAAGRADGSLFEDGNDFPGSIELFGTFRQTEREPRADAAPTQPFDVEDGREGVTFGPDLREGMTETLAVLRVMELPIQFED